MTSGNLAVDCVYLDEYLREKSRRIEAESKLAKYVYAEKYITEYFDVNGLIETSDWFNKAFDITKVTEDGLLLNFKKQVSKALRLLCETYGFCYTKCSESTYRNNTYSFFVEPIAKIELLSIFEKRGVKCPEILTKYSIVDYWN